MARALLDLDADVALLQEATAPPSDVAARIEVDDEPWVTERADGRGPWRAAVVRLTNRIQATWLKPVPLAHARAGDLAVTRKGTLAAAQVLGPDATSLTVLSLHGLWERTHPSAGANLIYADASAHRLISDLAALVGTHNGHRLLAAGDLNILHGYGERGNSYWAARYASVFERRKAMGLNFVGPQAPNGRCADPWPSELPTGSLNVPTYHAKGMMPAQACRQLDFVFASTALTPRVQVRAMNDPDDWGPSDHCRVVIEVRQ